MIADLYSDAWRDGFLTGVTAQLAVTLAILAFHWFRERRR